MEGQAAPVPLPDTHIRGMGVVEEERAQFSLKISISLIKFFSLPSLFSSSPCYDLVFVCLIIDLLRSPRVSKLIFEILVESMHLRSSFTPYHLKSIVLVPHDADVGGA